MEAKLNEALELLTKLRIGLMGSGNPSLEQKAYDIEIKICQAHDLLTGKNNPIPLTEEFLINKAGFKEVGDCIRKPLNEFLELCYMKQFKKLMLQTANSGFCMPLDHVIYIHNLQNFWKEHTGKELEIK